MRCYHRIIFFSFIYKNIFSCYHLENEKQVIYIYINEKSFLLFFWTKIRIERFEFISLFYLWRWIKKKFLFRFWTINLKIQKFSFFHSVRAFLSYYFIYIFVLILIKWNSQLWNTISIFVCLLASKRRKDSAQIVSFFYVRAFSTTKKN